MLFRSIHRKRMPVTEVKSGQTASFSLKKIKRSQIRKGMVMIHPALEPQCCYEFEGEILVLHHPITISWIRANIDSKMQGAMDWLQNPVNGGTGEECLRRILKMTHR